MKIIPTTLSPAAIVHRLGGGNVENLQLKPKEQALVPPGISLFQGDNCDEIRKQIYQAFPNATRLLAAAETVGAATVAAIRRVGFDVLADPTRQFPNHVRLIHPAGAAGFSDANLRSLSKSFTNETRS